MTKWLRLEHAEAKRDGAKPQKNSGRSDHQKGDAILDGFTVDYKMSAKSFTLTKLVWGKATADAVKNDLSIPAIKVILGAEDEPKTRLWVIDEDTFNEFREAYNALQEQTSSN